MSIFQTCKPELADVYDSYADMLYRLALTQLQNAHDAEDAVQDVFLRYFKAPALFRDEVHVRAWLVRVTINRCRDVQRQRSLHGAVPIEEAQELPSGESPEDTYEARELRQHLYELPEKYRLALILHELEGLSVQETANVLNVTPSAVKMRLSRGRELLKKALGGD